MGISFFQTAPQNHMLRYAILCNTIALIFILFAFGYSYAVSSSTIRLSSNIFSTEFAADSSVVATLAPMQISLRGANDSIVCPRDSVSSSSAFHSSLASANWSECLSFQASSKASLAFDGVTFCALIIIYCIQRCVTMYVTDESTLVCTYFALECIPVASHFLARVIFDAIAAKSAIAFLKQNSLAFVGGINDNTIAVLYGPVQRLHVAASCMLAVAFTLVALKLVHVKMLRRIESVELLRECAARRRSEAPPGEQRPLRWMLDPTYHPLFDADELAVIKHKIAHKESSSEREFEMLEQQLVVAEAEWRRQQAELENEQDAFREYAHRIRREERVMGRAVVDDWQRQRDVWEHRKEMVMKQFEQMGIVAGSSGSSPSVNSMTSNSPFATGAHNKNQSEAQ